MNSAKMPTTLSKSKYLAGLKCPLLLWSYYNAPEKIPKVDEATQALFDQGREIEVYAHSLYPGGILIPYDKRLDKTVEKTQKMLPKRKTLFEASFHYKHTYARVDILVPVNKDEWDIIEVKSGTEVEEVHFYDVAFQKYCLQKCGLKIRNCFLMHINNAYVRHGKINPNELMKTEDITVSVDSLVPKTEEFIDLFVQIIAREKVEWPIGPQCKDPYDCPLIEQCWSFLPEHNVTEFYRLGKKSFEFIKQGVLCIKDAENVRLSEIQIIQKTTVLEDRPHMKKDNIKAFLGNLSYPIHFFDFETIQTAIPLYDGIHPYQQIPFQFSLHILESRNKKPKHYKFLHSGKKDPRPKLLAALKKSLRKEGTVLVFNASFEKNILRKLAESFPTEESWLNNILERTEDLLIPFRSFWYYHPKQHGSCSIKSLAPALINKSYESMEIKEGKQAGLEWLKTNFTKIAKEKKAKIRKNLLEYCKQDTQIMIDIVRLLEKETNRE